MQKSTIFVKSISILTMCLVPFSIACNRDNSTEVQKDERSTHEPYSLGPPPSSGFSLCPNLPSQQDKRSAKVYLFVADDNNATPEKVSLKRCVGLYGLEEVDTEKVHIRDYSALDITYDIVNSVSEDAFSHSTLALMNKSNFRNIETPEQYDPYAIIDLLSSHQEIAWGPVTLLNSRIKHALISRFCQLDVVMENESRVSFSSLDDTCEIVLLDSAQQ